MSDKKQKGQMNSMIIMFFVVIFLGAVMFFFMLGKSVNTVSEDEYMKMYSSSLLITLSNTDTGLDGSKCEKISDLAYYGLLYGNSCICTDNLGTSDNCLNWLRERMNIYFSDDPNKISFNRANLDYYLIFSLGVKEESFGDGTLETAKKNKWSTIEEIFKTSTKKLKTQIILAKKPTSRA